MNRPIRTLLTAALMAVLVGSVAVQPVHAENRAKCQRNVEKAEANLDQAISRHGEHSKQAEQRRRDLAKAREKCWNENHAWYNAHERQWHNDRDWDRH